MVEWLFSDPKGQWALVGVVVVFILFVMRWFYKHKSEHDIITHTVNGMESGIGNINLKLDKLLFHIAGLGSSKSPLRLTDLGMRVSEMIDARSIAKELAPAMIDQMRGLPEFDIQEQCHRHFLGADRRLTEDQCVRFKQCAYKEGLELEHLYLVCAIELRDELLRMVREESVQRNLDLEGNFAPLA